MVADQVWRPRICLSNQFRAEVLADDAIVTDDRVNCFLFAQSTAAFCDQNPRLVCCEPGVLKVFFLNNLYLVAMVRVVCLSTDYRKCRN